MGYEEIRDLRSQNMNYYLVTERLLALVESYNKTGYLYSAQKDNVHLILIQAAAIDPNKIRTFIEKERKMVQHW